MLLKSLTWPTLRKLDNKETNHLRNFGQYISNSDDQHLLNNGFKSKKNDKNLIFKVPIFKLHGDMESSERYGFLKKILILK